MTAQFAHWYVNFEAPRARAGNRIDTVDWHLDLLISPDGQPAWKDEHEALAALEAGHLHQHDYDTARIAGQHIINDLQRWPAPIGDWRSFRPDPTWPTPDLPADWAAW